VEFNKDAPSKEELILMRKGLQDLLYKKVKKITPIHERMFTPVLAILVDFLYENFELKEEWKKLEEENGI